MTRRRWLAGALGLAVVAAVWAKPADVGGDYDPYFAGLNGGLKAAAIGAPCALVDLDRLDRNIALVRRRLGHRKLRVVVKSLPSVDLIGHMLNVGETNRVMVFQPSHIDPLFAALGPQLDMLLGKPVPVAAARRVRAADRVAWLIDNVQRLHRYLDWAKSTGLRLPVSIELDVGLHRGGVTNEGDLAAMLTVIRNHPRHLRLAGFMGYDGHVPYAPALLQSREAATKSALRQALDQYAAFLRFSRDRFPDLLAGRSDLVFNSGGSRTYPLYEGLDTEVNDLALGSALVKPLAYDDPFLNDHAPALYLAGPILKRLDTPPLPFLDRLWGWVAWWNPNRAVGFFTYGGTWGAPVIAPQGMQLGYYQDAQIENLLPNQALLNGSAKVLVTVGDYVFFRPKQSDLLAAFRTLLPVRSGRLTGERWHPFEGLN